MACLSRTLLRIGMTLSLCALCSCDKQEPKQEPASATPTHQSIGGVPSTTTAPTTTASPSASADAPPTTAPLPVGEYTHLTAEQLDAIDYDDLQPDSSDVTPLAATIDDLDADSKKRLQEISDRMDDWAPANEKDPVQKVRNLISLCAVVDILQDPLEPYVPRMILDRLNVEIPKAQLGKILGWIILHPTEGTVVTTAPDLGFEITVIPDESRERTVMYARKFLARVLGKVKDTPGSR